MPLDAATLSTPSETVRRAGRGGRPALLSRELILDAARQIPARELTMPVVARRLNVSAAALYRHFESRDALLAALGAQLADAFELRPADPARWRDWLLDTNVALFRFLIDNPVILAAPDWAYVSGMAQRLLEAAYATLEGAGFEPVDTMEIWGVVSGHAYLGARLIYEAPAADESIASGDDPADTIPRWLAITRLRAAVDPQQQLIDSLRWLVSMLPEPGQGPRATASTESTGVTE